MVPSATLHFLESSLCAQPKRARAARICLPLMVINEKPYHGRARRTKKLLYLVN